MTADIHLGQPIISVGTDDQKTDRIVILLHGRGASAQSIVPIAESLSMDGVRFILPQAALNRWYPQSAFGPLEANEPDLSSALRFIDSIVKDYLQKGYSEQQIAFGGFSQGACLASEYVARNAKKYAGLFILSGALIGPPGTIRNYAGSFDKMPVFIGCSDVDPWVPYDLVEDTARNFEKLAADVDFRIYTGMAHTINQDEIDAVRAMLVNGAVS